MLLRIAQSRVLSDVKLDPSENRRHHVNIVNNNWYNVVRAVVQSPFESLQKLDVSLTDNERNLLFPHLGNVTDLTLRLADAMSKNHLASLCHLPGLRKISIGSYYGGPVDGKIDGETLVQLARHCPRLISIMVGGVAQHLIAPTVSDSEIEEVVRTLPNLEEFHFEADDTRLTENSILQFGQHCKELRSLIISGGPDYVELANSGPAGLFPKLKNFVLKYYPRNSVRLQSFRTLSNEELIATAGRIARMMPECESFESKCDNARIRWAGDDSVKKDSLILDSEVMRILTISRRERARVIMV